MLKVFCMLLEIGHYCRLRWGGERRILGDHVVFKRDGGGRVSHRYKYEEGIDSQ